MKQTQNQWEIPRKEDLSYIQLKNKKPKLISSNRQSPQQKPEDEEEESQFASQNVAISHLNGNTGKIKKQLEDKERPDLYAEFKQAKLEQLKQSDEIHNSELMAADYKNQLLGKQQEDDFEILN